MKEEKVMIYIDGSNFYHGLKRHNIATTLDYYKFSILLCGDRKLVRTYYYNVPVKQHMGNYKSQQKFFSQLDGTPYLKKVLGRLEKRGSTYVEKGVDIKLATDMLRMAYRNLYDVAILVSGDGDFEPVVESVEELGKHVENAYCWTKIF